MRRTKRSAPLAAFVLALSVAISSGTASADDTGLLLDPGLVEASTPPAEAVDLSSAPDPGFENVTWE